MNAYISNAYTHKPNGCDKSKISITVLCASLTGKREAIVGGNVIIAVAKITGITPAGLILNGRKLTSFLSRLNPLPVCCNGIFLSDSLKNETTRI